MAITFKGYAVVSADGFIANQQGRMPEDLRYEADWAYFQAALDTVDITLLGRHTHTAAPNVKGRRRLVVSRGVRAVIREDASTWWVNPKEMTPTSAVAAVAGATAEVAVVGGTGVFGWILDEGGYQEFHLSLAHKVRLSSGRPLLDGTVDLATAIAKLEQSGLRAARRTWLDREAGLELLVLEAMSA